MSKTPRHDRLTRIPAKRAASLALAFCAVAVAWTTRPEASWAAKAGPPFARLTVTVDVQSGASRVPSPFTVLPDETRAAIYVPDTGGVLLLRGDDVLHHFPIPNVPADGSSALDDLDASDDLLVGGKWTPADPITVELHIFDLVTGRALAHIESRNPHLGGDANDLARSLWRVVVERDTVGVYDPRLGASVPLWVRGAGLVESAEQMARMRAGIGFGRPGTWVPVADGTLACRSGGRALSVPWEGIGTALFGDDARVAAGANAGEEANARFIALIEPILRPDAPPSSWAKDAIRMTLVTVSLPCLRDARDSCIAEGARQVVSVHDSALSPRVPWIRGRPMLVRGLHVYWPFLGIDELEIRRRDISWFVAP